MDSEFLVFPYCVRKMKTSHWCYWESLTVRECLRINYVSQKYMYQYFTGKGGVFPNRGGEEGDSFHLHDISYYANFGTHSAKLFYLVGTLADTYSGINAQPIWNH